jgi:glucosamine 6-phosphate synthetase-like amidotransferase/phosphosugar isomerase protein
MTGPALNLGGQMAALHALYRVHTIAAVTPDVPVIALNVRGLASGDAAALVRDLRARGVRVVAVGDGEDGDLPLPPGLPEALAPACAVVRGQQLARELALRFGLDRDAPAGLSKVTVT